LLIGLRFYGDFALHLQYYKIIYAALLALIRYFGINLLALVLGRLNLLKGGVLA